MTTPLIVMTGFGDERLAVEIMKSGAVDYIVKSESVFENMPGIARKSLRFWENIQERLRAEKAEHETQKRLADILAFLPDPVLAIDKNGTVIAWNNAMEGLTGVPAADMLGKGNHEYSLPFYGERRSILIDLVLEDDPAVETKYNYIKHDGQKIISETFLPRVNGGKGAYIWGTASPIFDAGGNVAGAIEIVRDISDQKQAEKEITFKNIVLSTQQETSPDGILIVDENAVILHCNQKFAEIWNIPDDLIVSRVDEPILQYVVGQIVDPETFLARVRYLYDHKDEKSYEELHLKDGRILERFSAPMLGENGKYFGRIWYFRDITGRQQAEQIIKASEEKFRTLIENVPDFIIVHRQGILLFVNRAASDIIGHHPDELLGKQILDFVIPEDRERIISAMQRRLKNEPVEPYEITIMTQSGGRRQVIIRGSRIEYEGAPASLNVLTDITAMRKGEIALAESEIRFRDLFNNMSSGVVIYEPISGGQDFIIRDINHAVEKIENVRKEDVVGKRVLQVFPGVKEFGLFAVFQRVSETGIAEAFPVSHYQDNRISGWRENYIYKLSSEEIVAIYEDVTEKKQAEELLRQKTALLEAQVNSVSDGIIIVDSTGKKILQNRRAVELWKIPPHIANDSNDETQVRHVMHMTKAPEHFVETVKYLYDHPYATSRDEVELTDGTILDRYSAPVLGDDGHNYGRIWSFHDITERKRIEDALRESEERYRALLQGAGVGVGYWDIDGNLLYLNEISLQRLKGSQEDFIGKNILELMGDDAETYLGRFHEAAVSRKPLEYEDYVHLPSGDGWYLSVYTRITRPDGGVRGIQVLSMDITDRKQTEQALADEAARRRILVSQSRDGIVTLDQDGKIFESNQRFADMLGYSPEEMKDLHVWDWEAIATKEQLEGMISSVNEGGDHFETRHRRKDGSLLDVDITTNAAVFTGKKLIFCVVRDISEKKAAARALEASEQKFRSLVEYALEVIFILDLEGKILFSNTAAARILEAGTPGELIGRNAMEFVAPESREDALHDFGEVARGHDAYLAQYKVITAKGEEIYVESIGKVITYEGKLANLVSLRDVTARVQAEEVVRQNETRFSALIQNSSDIIRVLDRNGLVVYESDSAERILGYPRGYIIGKNPLDFIHPDDLTQVKEDLLGVFDQTNSGLPTEFRIRKADGEYLWVESLASNLLDTPGVNGIVITTRPIQQRKEAERALREGEERLRLALEGADAGFWDWHLPSGNAVFSDRFYTMLGYKPGEFPATYEAWMGMMHPDDRKRVIPDLERQIHESMTHLEIEYRIRAKEGNWIWLLGRGKVVENEEKGVPVRVTGVNIDITNRRLMESEIRSLNTVLEQRVKDRTEALSQANAALEEENAQRLTAEAKLKASLDEKTVLLKEIHHRVKNNLQIIASLLNLQSRYIKDESILATIRESQNRVKAMALVHEKLYRSEEISHIDLADYIRFLGTGLFQFYDAKKRGIRFTLDIPDIEVDINTAIPLGLIINELISNSLKYAFPAGRSGEILISMQRDGPKLTILFEDNGIGIPAELDWQNTQSLGLRLVNNLVDQLNGTIELDRSSGTRFTMVVQQKAEVVAP